ncbi:MAG: hypothetical protein DMG30_01090 [Acidobacteria bacterium]|nr:MAG: hypothetical protein DMG30_01090 [Acidobacteriota bacterium]
MDASGDIGIGYSASSSSIHPAIRYAGRVPGDPLGSLEAEVSMIDGTGSQTGGLSRWGDYSANKPGFGVATAVGGGNFTPGGGSLLAVYD